MVEVTIDSIRVSLMSQHRVVILKDVDSDRYLPIWIGPCEADAITVELQEVTVVRPLTHDLLKNVIIQMGGNVSHIVVSELKNDVFFARIIINKNGTEHIIDSRPSDAIALAVRFRVPIFIDETVMEHAAVVPEEGIEEGEGASPETEAKLTAFEDFVDTLNLDDLGGAKGSEEEPPED